MFTVLTIVAFLNLFFVSSKFSSPFLMASISLLISLIELTLYFQTALRNPGIVIPMGDLEIEAGGTRCEKCLALKIQGTVHCKECGVCIREMDHHCVWTGKCIGKGNLNWFWGFLAWTILFLSYHLATTLGVYRSL